MQRGCETVCTAGIDVREGKTGTISGEGACLGRQGRLVMCRRLFAAGIAGLHVGYMWDVFHVDFCGERVVCAWWRALSNTCCGHMISTRGAGSFCDGRSGGWKIWVP